MMTSRRTRFVLRIAFVAALATIGAGAATRAAVDGPADPTRVSQTELARLVRRCAPQVSAVTQAAIVAVESGGDSWAVHDDNDGHVYLPSTYESAIALVGALLRRNRDAYRENDRGVDIGLAQINSSNYAALGVTPDRMLDPCENLRASASIIVSAYVHERTLLSADGSWRGDQLALRRALQVYNSGRSSGDDSYVRAIFAAVDVPASAARTMSPASTAPPLAVRAVLSERPIARRSAPGRARVAPDASAQFVHVDVATPRPDAPQMPSSGAQFVHAAVDVADPTAAPR